MGRVPLPPRLAVKTDEEAEEKFDYSTKEMKPAGLILSDLLRAHSTFLLHHDSSLETLFGRTQRTKFIATLSRYWDLFLSTWSVMFHGNPTRAIYSGINMAASGELGVGVGEEERGSGEREVLEGLVGRVEGLVDLVVSKFGEDEEDAEPWLGSGREPSGEDGAVFLGIGTLSRPSLRNLANWMEDIYSWGDHAYGVIDSPTSHRRARPKKAEATVKPIDEAAKQGAASAPASAPADDGKLDKMVNYLKLGYGSYWSIPGVSSSAEPSGTATPQTEPQPVPKQPSSVGHFLIGLKGWMEEKHEREHETDDSSIHSEEDHNSRTVLRTVHVELQEPRQPEKLRVVVYVNRPFIFVFLFRLRTDSLALESLYRSLHYQLGPLRKPLLASTRFRPERPDAGSGIRDVLFSPDTLTLHSTLPSIPDNHHLEAVGPLAPPPRSWWSRTDAVSTHLHIVNIVSATRYPHGSARSDSERTQKTSRGWWIVWTRQAGESRPPSSHGEQHDGPVEAETRGKEVILVRRAGDHTRSLSTTAASGGGGAIETAGKLAQGIGVDTRRYIEDLLSIL